MEYVSTQVDGKDCFLVGLFAAQKIKPGTELLLHYGTAYDVVRKSLKYSVGDAPDAATRPNEADVRHAFQVYVDVQRIAARHLARAYSCSQVEPIPRRTPSRRRGETPPAAPEPGSHDAVRLAAYRVAQMKEERKAPTPSAHTHRSM